MKQQFLYNATDTIRLTVYDNNRPVVPSSGTVALYNPSGGVVQAAASVSIDGTTGEMTYSLTTTHTATRGVNFKAVWSYVVSGITYQQVQLFDIVRSILSIPITDDDLYSELDSLRRQNTQATGTVTTGAAGSIIDTVRRKETDDYWKGGTIEILAGTGAGQKREITGFTSSTSTVTVTPNFTTTPDTTSVYRVVKSFSVKINKAFTKLETMIYNKGNRHNLILESSQIEMPLIFLCIHDICLDFRDEVDDKWDLLARDYEKKFDQAYNTMKVDYDADDSGTIQGRDEEQASTSSMDISRT